MRVARRPGLGYLPASSQAACAPVAQLDRAPDYESGGQEFESLRARHLLFLRLVGLLYDLVRKRASRYGWFFSCGEMVIVAL